MSDDERLAEEDSAQHEAEDFGEEVSLTGDAESSDPTTDNETDSIGPAAESMEAEEMASVDAVTVQEPAAEVEVSMAASPRPANPPAASPLSCLRGEGLYLWDDDGNRYLDLTAGHGDANLGHCHPAITEAIARQASQLLAPVSSTNDERCNQLAERLRQRFFHGHLSLANDRCGAIERALRVARLRQPGQRYKSISFVGSYHGLTLGALTASGQPYLQEGLGPLVAGNRHCPYDDLEATRDAIDEQTAAILVQPIQTQHGVHVPDRSFLAGLRELADEHDLLLIFDESDLPVGITGDWLAAQSFDVQPDCLVVAAGLASGLPLAAVLLRDEIAESMAPTLQSHPALAPTAVSPLAVAASLAVLETIDHHDLLAEASRQGLVLQQTLLSLQCDFDFVENVQGIGLLAGLSLDVPLSPLRADLRRAGIVVGQANEKTLRCQLPLTVDEATLGQVSEILHQAFEAIEREPVDS